MNSNKTEIPQLQSNIMKISEKSAACDIKSTGYTYVPQLLAADALKSANWQSFKNSWCNLMTDNFMKDNGKYRCRRYAVLSYSDVNKRLYVEPEQPHYQSVTYNTLNGGIPRYFAQFEPHILCNEIFQSILYFLVDVCTELYGLNDWHIEAHQMHIKCSKDMTGKPTPEGIHRDGRDFVLIMFMDKKNIAGGQTTIYDLNKVPLTHCTMSMESETILIDDEKLFHSVSEIQCDQENENGYRNVLVVTFLSKAKVNDIEKEKTNLS